MLLVALHLLQMTKLVLFGDTVEDYPVQWD